MKYRHVILDRDGVLNCEPPDRGYVVRPEDFRWLPGALASLVTLRRAGTRLSVATNQSGVGRGLMTLAQLEAVHARMLAEAAAAGGAIDEVLVCPHAPEEGCDCRKPAPGLIETAIAHSGIPASETLGVGDDERDLQALERAGVAAALVRTGKGRQTEARMIGRADSRAMPRATACGMSIGVYDDLEALTRAMMAGSVQGGEPGLTGEAI
jgi:D-glycero-D-manno-heptose 1,7-bisphosphate phosphatase